LKAKYVLENGDSGVVVVVVGGDVIVGIGVGVGVVCADKKWNELRPLGANGFA